VTALAIPADAADPASIGAAIARAHTELGPVSVLHWNAYGGGETGDLVAADPATVGAVFDVAIVGLLAAVQAALPDLKAAGGAVLVTNGAFGDDTPAIDQLAVNLKSMGVALANAAKRKLVGLLAARLAADGVYVGEVTIAGAVQGTAWAREGGIESSRIAEAFWTLYQGRGETRARVS
jgi:NAD(P)-dependent dehydrogenase (short-subunit alcohol dehydrogenase family)